jgi:DNA polymerase-4
MGHVLRGSATTTEASLAARGVVAAVSYEAPQSVHSAMASVAAVRKCPGLIFAPPRLYI